MSQVIPSVTPRLATLYPYGWLVNESYTANWALDLDLTAEALDPRVTFTRASVAQAWNSSGVLTQSAAGVWRRTHDPVTLAPLGRLVEPSRTNLVANSSGAGGTSSVAPTGWTISTTLTSPTASYAYGVEDGLPYVDVTLGGVNSGGSAAFPSINFGSASSGNSVQHAMSAFTRKLSGATAISAAQIRAVARDSGGTSLGQGLLTLTSASSLRLSRPNLVYATPAASTATINPGVVFTVSAGETLDITLRIACPQLEVGDYATSPILTAGAAVTRAADSAVITGANFSSWYEGATECTIYAEGTAGRVGTTALACLDNGSNSEFMGVLAARSASSSASGQVFAGGVLQADWTQGVHTGGAKRVAMRVKANSVRVAANGTLIGAEDTTAVYPTVDRLILGQRSSGGVELAGTLKTVRIARVGFGDAELAALTA